MKLRELIDLQKEVMALQAKLTSLRTQVFPQDTLSEMERRVNTTNLEINAIDKRLNELLEMEVK